MSLINSIRPKPQSIAMICNGCMKEKSLLAWFGMTPLNQGLYCGKCWQERFKRLSNKQKNEWSFWKLKQEKINASK